MRAKVTPRSLVLEALCAIIRDGKPLDDALVPVYESDLSGQDKAFVRQLLMVTLRHAGQLNALIKPYLKKPLTDKLLPVQQILLMGAAQLYVMHTATHAAIDTSVQLCKSRGFQHQAGLVNAVLRNLTRDKPPLPAARENIPLWLRKSWAKAYGKQTVADIAAQFIQEPPLDIQLKPNKDYSEGDLLLPQMRRLPNADITQLSGYADGDWWVQDVAASLPVRLLGDVSGLRVLDACAAPGGKTLQLAASGASVTAVDRSQKRVKRLHENLMRTGLTATVVTADMEHYQPETMPDIVLLDAPCSATGTIRRHPDILVRKTQQDVEEMVALQRRILNGVMRWLPSAVPLIYCVCSLQPEEGEQQIQWLLDEYADMKIEAIDAEVLGWPKEWQTSHGTIRTLPHYWAEQGGMDGFFIAKLLRR